MIPLLNSFLTLAAYRNRPTVVTIAASMSRYGYKRVTALFHRAAAWRVIDGPPRMHWNRAEAARARSSRAILQNVGQRNIKSA